MKTRLMRAIAALLAFTFVHPLWAAPGDVTQVPAPVLGADPPKARDISDGDASVATQTGALNYGYPIAVPPGRRGMQPALALSYSSQAPLYGGVAANWSLSIPEIRLDTSESVLQQKYWANLSADPWARERYVSTLSGSRPFVEVTAPHESTVYQTYRAQNDASWIRYERMNAGQPYLWRAWSPDGLTHYFGDTSLSGSTPSPDVVPLTRTVDSFGNTVEYEWEGGQIEEIRYTSNPGAQLSAFARVEFDYVDESCGRLPVGAAEDARLGWIDGARRLTTIRAVALDPAGAVKHTRVYTLSYDQAALSCTAKHAPQRILTSIQESASIAGQSPVVLPAVTFEYNRLAREFDLATTEILNQLWTPNPFTDQASLSVGQRSPAGWPSVDGMMLDFDGDGRVDRISHVPHPTECVFQWERNEGRDPSTGRMEFAEPIEQVMPRLPWKDTQRSGDERCSLNYQFTRRTNVADPPGSCEDNLGSYLAYRWLDMNADGRVDLVAAVHLDRFFDPNAETAPSFFANLRIAPTWPSCTPDGGACPALSSVCMQDALVCEPEEPCRLHEPAVSACLAASDRVTCDRLMKGMDQYGPNDPDQNPMRPPSGPGVPPPSSECGRKVEHERCDRYPWMIHENTGGALEPTGEVKYQPVPLESDGGDSAMTGGGVLASTSHAVQDMDGDGYLDLAVRGRYVETTITTNPMWWFVFRGDGSGNFLPADDGDPYVWYVPENAQIHGTCPSNLSDLCNPALGGDDGVINGYTSLLDLNGDSAADLVWSLQNGTQLEAHAFWGTGLHFTNFGLGQPQGYSVGQSLALMSRAFVHADQRILQGPYFGWVEDGWRQGHIQPVDVDDDGRPDLVTSPLDQYTLAPQPLHLYFNGGGTFLAPRDLAEDPALQQALVQRMEVDSSTGSYFWATKRDLIDMDGDGLPEHWDFTVGPDVTVTRDEDDQPLRLLKHIDNGRGGTVDIDYAATTDEEVVTQEAATDRALPRTQWVVKSMSVKDQWDPADVSTTTYEYKHPVWNQDERGRWGFRGFEEVTTTAPSMARTVETYAFNVDWSGRLAGTRTYATEDLAGPRTIREMTWEPFTLFGGALVTYQTTHDRTWTCSNGQTEAQCKNASNGLLHKRWIYQQLPTTGTAQLYVANQIYNLDTESYVSGARRTVVTTQLRSDATSYRLQETFIGTLQRSSSLVFSEDWVTYTLYGYDPQLRYRTHTDAYFDISDLSKRGVTVWTVDESTGLTLTEQAPRNYPNGPVTTYAYDPTGRFVTTTTNELGQVVVRTYEPGTGALLSERGPNSSSCQFGCVNWEQTWTDVDGLGRPIATHSNVQVGTNPVWQKTKDSRTTYTDTVVAGARTKVVVENRIEWGGDRWTREETRLDSRGRPDEVIVDTGAGPDAVSTYDYDHRGHLVAVSLPDPSQNSAATVTYTYGYDSLGRPTSMRRPVMGTGAASGVDLRYDGLRHEREEIAGAQLGPAALTKLVHDHFGRLREVHENAGGGWAITFYEYDARDAVSRIQNPDGVVTQLFHDMGGRRVRIARAGKDWIYGYDAGGNMVSESAPPPSQLQAAAYTTSYGYDVLGRPSSRVVGVRTMTDPAERELFGVGTVTFTHDSCPNGAGRLCAVDFPDGVLSTDYAYDAEGNRTSETRAFDFAGVTGTRSTSVAFGPGGTIVEQTYADGSPGASDATRATFHYDDRGQPHEIKWLRSGIPGALTVATQTRNVAGLVTTRATNLATSGWLEYASTWTYDKLTRVESQTITDSLAAQLARQQLEYFGQDDPERLEHWMGTSYYDLTFGYDQRHHLASVHEGQDRFEASYAFTPAGKLSHVDIAVNGTPGAGSDVIPRQVDYAYNSPSDPEAVSALVPVGGGQPFRSYAYDTVGNMESRFGGDTSDAFLYDGEDQLRRATITDAATSDTTTEEYFYDHTGQRTAVVTRDTSNNVATVRVFLGDTEVLLTPGAATKTYAHLSLGTPVARITDRTDLELQYHGLANNTLLSIKPDGATSSGFVYAPYGELLESTGTALAEQHRRFNDKFRDDATKLSYYGVRYYDGLLLLWTQADPLYRLVPDLEVAKPRTASLYVFSANSPIRYLDPDGRGWIDDVRNGIADAVEVTFTVVGGAVGVVTGGPVGAWWAGPLGAFLGGSFGYSAASLIRPGGPEENFSVEGAAQAGVVGAASELGGYVFFRVLTRGSRPAGKLAESAAAEARADEVHAVLDPIAKKQRTTAVLSTDGETLVGGGAKRDLTPAQRAALNDGEAASRAPGKHAEATVLADAEAKGLQPKALGVSRKMCPDCKALVESKGGTLLSDFQAVFRPLGE